MNIGKRIEEEEYDWEEKRNRSEEEREINILI
jgi:hypothetical protein